VFKFLLPQTVLCFAGLWLPKYASMLETLKDTYREAESLGTLLPKVHQFFVTKGLVSPENIWSDGVNQFFKMMHYNVFL
jgi:hypothetical protein